ncbi:hypothetical protein CAPTEDRAFT_92693, partial [Capitella teleta]
FHILTGLRKVYPYYFTFTVYAKGRWLGQTLLDVFTQEFKSTGREYNIHAIESGKLRVNGQSVNVDYKLKHNDFISSITHRHEVPVTADPIEIIANTEDILVVNKPSSIPMHPCGRYRHNSLVYILAKDYNLHNLRPIYRLDRLTSGVTIIARTESKAKELHKLIEGRKVRKEYLCKVEGVFPDERIECKEPLEVLTHSLGLFKVGKNGKESWTTFELVSTDGETSIVRCQPHTGRTHQIRVHLQFLGFPIVNDRIYNSPEWGPNKGKGGDFGRPDEEVNLFVHALDKMLRLKSVSAILLFYAITNRRDRLGDENLLDAEALVDRKVAYLFSTNNQVSYDGESPAKKPKLDSARTSSDFDESKMTHDDMCFECKNDFRDPDPEELVMYLHAYKYGADGWEYSTTVPKWAKCSELENPLDEEKTDASPTVE